MPIENLIGPIILIAGFIWIAYILIYWTNLVWRFPEKFREIAITNATHLPKWFPFRDASLKRAERQSIWPARLILLFIDTIFLLALLVTIFAFITNTKK